MSIKVRLKNHEGYNDPTAYAALNHILKEEKSKEDRASYRIRQDLDKPKSVVYICSPIEDYSSTSRLQLQKYRRFVLQANSIPVATTVLLDRSLVANEAELHELCANTGHQLMNHCDEVWVFGKNFTRTMANEITKAICRQKKIRYFTTDCKEIERHARA